MKTITKTFQPSSYQQAVFNHVKYSNRNLIIKATAGSGKTSTLIEAAKLVDGHSLFLAFNRHIVTELKSRLPGNFDCKTVHGICFGILKKKIKFTDVNSYKYQPRAKDTASFILSSAGSQLEGINQLTLADELVTLVKFCQLTLTNPEDEQAIEQMIKRFNLDIKFAPLVIPRIKNMLLWGDKECQKGNLDYNDMIYFPIMWNCYFPQYDNVFVDEAQDLNNAQTEILLRVKRNTGRIIAVGDSSQAVYKFAGANSDSLKIIASRLEAEQLPLSICYRCPISHIELAQDVDPTIQPAPGAIQGEIVEINDDKVNDIVKSGDLIVCRTIAPLVSKCLQLIALKINARVKGRNISKQLTSIITEVSELKGFTFSDFGQYLEMWAVQKFSRLNSSKASDDVIQSYADRIEGIKVCYESILNCTNVKQLNEEIDKLFSDSKADVWLSTIHGIKGLEAERIIVLRYSSMPLRWKGQSACDLEQEYNLKFIALTRSKHTLILVNG